MRLRQVCIHPWLAQNEHERQQAAHAAGDDPEADPDAHPSGVGLRRFHLALPHRALQLRSASQSIVGCHGYLQDMLQMSPAM